MVISTHDVNADEIINGNREDKRKYFIGKMKRQKFTLHKIDVGGNNKNDLISLRNYTEQGVPPIRM